VPRRTAEDARRTAQRLVEVATEVFIERGFAATSMTEVCRRAGVTRGAMYHHFGDKTSLFRGVVRTEHERIRLAIEQAVQNENSDLSRIKKGSRAFLVEASGSRSTRMLLVEAPNILGWNEWRQMDQGASVEALREGLSGMVSLSELEPLALALSGAMNELAVWVARHGDSEFALNSATSTVDRMIEAIFVNEG